MGLDMHLYQLKKVDENDDVEKIGDAFTYYDYLDDDEVTREKFDKVDPYEYWLVTNRRYEDLDFDIINKYKNHTLYNGKGSLFDELIYWGKANAIHEFFIKNSMDYDENIPYDDFNGRYLEISPNTLIKLRDICQEIVNNSVLEGDDEYTLFGKIKDPTKAKELLPTKSGFFFGNTQYDGSYLNKLKYTIEELDYVFSDEDWDKYHYYYCPSW